ncbi:plasmodesmata-located protein 7-like [Cajanus cajan]|uniref:Cysteine-rich repeat secretory protein 60 n=1 Tax=Cajanus cajan TaxID=3821 RepID=A0A151QMU0_CAJCA|nr:plasmodesmata-located protein 7-like [Cajanus cajan]KYP31596.1 Cysteine-rich repeat secretory protein 60 [Cajanus cajan]
MLNCTACIAHTITLADDICRQTCKGIVQLDGYFVKYDNATFLGVKDKAVVFKKCGPSVGYNPDAMASGDAVLAVLSSGGRIFTVGGSGDMRGVL